MCHSNKYAWFLPSWNWHVCDFSWAVHDLRLPLCLPKTGHNWCNVLEGADARLEGGGESVSRAYSHSLIRFHDGRRRFSHVVLNDLATIVA